MSHTSSSLIDFFNQHDYQRKNNRNPVAEAWGCEIIHTVTIPQSLLSCTSSHSTNPLTEALHILTAAINKTEKGRVQWSDVIQDDDNIIVATQGFGPHLMQNFMTLLVEQTAHDDFDTSMHVIDRQTFINQIKEHRTRQSHALLSPA